MQAIKSLITCTVKFVDYNTGVSKGMITTSNNTIKIGVDTVASAPGGRNSIRITSKAAYTTGLIILDLAHMPGSICGSWPAFWTVGPNWPANGEIDIIEGVNSNQANQMTLHTPASPACSISGSAFSGKTTSPNCYINAGGQAANAGCAIEATQKSTYGDDFNAAGGGIYATEWTNDHISIYHFAAGSAPADIAAGAPNPAGWGQPAASWPASGCNIGGIFKNHNIVFDNTFCGEWAGAVWGNDNTCKAKAGSCQDYVANHGADFAESFWEINSLKVYTDDGSGAPAVASSAPVSSAASKTGAASAATQATTLLSIPYPQSSGAQLLSNALPSPSVLIETIIMTTTVYQPAATATAPVKLLAGRHMHQHHARGLHAHGHAH
jgi:hypothetical protein